MSFLSARKKAGYSQAYVAEKLGSMSGTFLTPGGGLFIKRSELARLGLRQQRLGVLDVYGTSDGRNGHSV